MDLTAINPGAARVTLEGSLALVAFAIVAAHLIAFPRLLADARVAAVLALCVSAIGFAGVAWVLSMHPRWVFRACLAYAAWFLACGHAAASRTADPAPGRKRTLLGTAGIVAAVALAAWASWLPS